MADDVREGDAKFLRLLESAPDAIIITRGDGRIELVNAQAERLFGYARDQMIGHTIDLLVPDRLRAGHERHVQRYFTDARTRPMGAGVELYGRRQDGSEFPVEISLSPLETESGTMALSAVRDISDRRKADAKFRALLESAPDAMVIVDRAGRIAIVNAQTEQMFGYRRHELLGQPVELLVPMPYRDSSRTAQARLRDGGPRASHGSRTRAVRPAQGRHPVPRRNQPQSARNGRRAARGERHPRHIDVPAPRVTPRAQPRRPAALPADDNARLRLDGLRVLVVDDAPDERALFSEILSARGAVVQTAASAAAGIEIARSFSPHAIVTDIAMPNEDGYAFLRRLRTGAAAGLSSVPVVAVTAHARAEDRERALAAGFRTYVSKPVQPDRLVTVVARAVEGDPSSPLS